MLLRSALLQLLLSIVGGVEKRRATLRNARALLHRGGHRHLERGRDAKGDDALGGGGERNGA